MTFGGCFHRVFPSEKGLSDSGPWCFERCQIGHEMTKQSSRLDGLNWVQSMCCYSLGHKTYVIKILGYGKRNMRTKGLEERETNAWSASDFNA